MVSPSRRQFLSAAALAAIGISGCVGRSSETTPTPGSAGPDEAGRADGTAADSADGATADSTSVTDAVPTADAQLPLPMEPATLRDNAMSGGPSKDGIPSIDDPKFLAPDAVDYLAPGDPVFGVERDGVAKAYPQKILAHHEIVNDELAGTNVAVTYCPLTGTVQGFERGETTFGVSGRLINNNLVMYDRATETWWPQILATSIPGPWNEDASVRSLRELRLVWTTWERWRRHEPETRVLSTDTGHARNYGSDPYGSYNPRGGYYANGNLLFPALNSTDRFDKKTVVMGARTADGAVAFLKESLRDQSLMTGELGAEPVLAVYDPALDTGYVYWNSEEEEYRFEDGSVVGPDGTAHEPDSLPLSRVHTFDAMWFAWGSYYPETDVYE
ncbi:hypothetical protein C475_19248 [Halosimplex carlsbadense 2-9-1]|uniref:DUF3179 domain-containing protein n=1 Tax=Halosimplex carlsbadense 2-9-1 TaxID=797114 RepID=M0CCX6_9EURY|nr:DUF3179 domain-containing protein [Halosimplex carlsbadense]ELZ21126.1 hypothetical protein C475_19248 [Halosimplex carlsbadense 2-9-1]